MFMMAFWKQPKMSINKWMDKAWEVFQYLIIEYYASIKKSNYWYTYNNMDGSQNRAFSKNDKKGWDLKLDDIYVNKKYWYKMIIFQKYIV